MNLTDLYNQFLSTIANSKTILQLAEVLGIQNGDYVVVFSTQLQQPVKVKKENIQFPTTSFIRAETLVGFPNTGALDSLYLENSTNKLYKWDSVTSSYKWLLESEIQAINDSIALKLDKGTYVGDAAGLLAEAKSYSDSLQDGSKWKDAVDIATTGNVVLSGEQTIDGVVTSASRAAVLYNTNQTENGIYITAAGAWTRATDADTGPELVAATFKVLTGTVNQNKEFTNTNATITLGTTNITFAFRGSGTDHNSTTGKQGGTANEYYHLTSAEHTKVQNLPATSESTANKAVDFSVINDTKYPTIKAVEDRVNAADDVKGYVNKVGFPATGAEDILYIDRDLRQLWVWSLVLNDYDLVGGVSQEYVDEQDTALETRISSLESAEGSVSPTRIDSWVLGYASGLTFNPTFNFTIDGVPKTDSREITLATADPTNPRVDVFVVNISTEQIEVLTGTPAANPAEPDVDFSIYLKGPTVDIPAGATAPANIDIKTLYNENLGTAGGESDVSGGVDFDFANTENPKSGTKAIKVVGELSVNQSIILDLGTDFPIAQAKELQLDIQNINTGGFFHVTVYGKRRGGRTDSFRLPDITGFDPANIASYQTLTLPIASSQLESIYRVNIVNEVAGYKFYLDKVRFLGGEGTSAPTGDYVTRTEFEALDSEVVKTVRLNGVTYNRDANGLVDLGTIQSGSSYTPPVDYTDKADLLANQANQVENEEYTMLNANGWNDPEQDAITHSNWATVKYLGTTAGTEADYDLREQFDVDSGGSATSDVWGEKPTGTINGTNKIFTVSQAYVAGKLRVFRNGVRQTITDDYTETSSTTFEFIEAPVVDSEGAEKILIDYTPQ